MNWCERFVTEDERESAEKCEGAADMDSCRCECSVWPLAADDVREGWGVVERRREMDGCRYGRVDGVRGGVGISSGEFGGSDRMR